MKKLKPGEHQCKVCNGIFELKLLSTRDSKIYKTINCVYCGNRVGTIQTAFEIQCIEIPKR